MKYENILIKKAQRKVRFDKKLFEEENEVHMMLF